MRIVLVDATMQATFAMAGRVMKKLLIAGHQASIPEILTIAGDTLGDLLDKQQGHTVTDKDIYRSIADRHHRICPRRLRQVHCL